MAVTTWTAGEVLAAADLNDTFASKVDYATPTNAQSGTAYTFVADDAERLTTASNGSAVTFTIPPQSSVTWGDDTILRVVNYGAGALTVAGGTGVTVTNTATVINQYGGGAAIRTGSDAWTFVPFGAGEPPFSATGGNETVTVGGYTYHVFTSSSTFVVSAGSRSCDILVVGGGGGGGRGDGGGGGAGAIEPASGYSSQTLSANSYTVTVGALGSGATSDNVKGGTGGTSSFVGTSTVSALGGGGGGSDANTGGATGGSGGGGSKSGAAGSSSGSNTNNGAAGTGTNGGGGGGATAAGSSANGGQGKTLTDIDANLTSGNFTSLSGMTVISSGAGGGGPSGGSSGTGAGSAGVGTGSDGGAATSFGSGGGGGGTKTSVNGNGGNGKAGVVIVRYAV